MKRVDLKLLEELSPAALPSLVAIAGGRKVSIKPTRHLPPALIYVLREIQREVGLEKGEDGGDLASSELQEIIGKVANRLGFELSSLERDEVLAQLERSQNEFGILQELVDDSKTSDIIVTNFTKIDVQQGRKNLSTDFSFSDQESYEAFIERLLHRAGTTYSTAKPIADGTIGNFARVHAVHKCLCESGPYLTIRLNRFPSVTLENLVQFHLAPEAVFEYLKGMIKSGQTLLVVGEVGTGKTTLVRALASSMPTHESILVIEDTAEIILEHPHVRYIYTRDANTDGAGRVPPAECIRAGMRMAMNRIIFGEMRDAEAAEAFIDVCASGHPGLSTIHARNGAEAILRLELFLGRAQKGVARNVIYDQIAKSIQAIVFLDICKVTGKRRIFEVKEIGPVSEGVIRQREIFQYRTLAGRPSWKVPTRASVHREQLEMFGVRMGDLPDLIEGEE